MPASIAPTSTASNVMVVERQGRIGDDGLLSTCLVMAELRARNTACGAKTLMATRATVAHSAATPRDRRTDHREPPQRDAEGEQPGATDEHAGDAHPQLQLTLGLAAPSERRYRVQPGAQGAQERDEGRPITLGAGHS